MSDKYLFLEQLGAGTFAEVFRALKKSDKDVVAIKRIKVQPESHGLEFTALREMKYLKEIRHENVVHLVDVYLDNKIINLVLEFCPFDLENVIRDKEILITAPYAKGYMKMMLGGLDHLHQNFILHRDLKPANILFNEQGVLKLADFGLARSYGSPMTMTTEVVTLWYRAPELLYGATHYGGAIDIWAAGCIFAEIVLRRPLFMGESNVSQLGKIFNVLGTPGPTRWSNASLLANYEEFEPREPLDISSLFAGGAASKEALTFLMTMLELDPNQRFTAAQALEHNYFSTGPAECSPGELPVPARVAAARAARLARAGGVGGGGGGDRRSVNSNGDGGSGIIIAGSAEAKEEWGDRSAVEVKSETESGQPASKRSRIYNWDLCGCEGTIPQLKRIRVEAVA